MRETYLTAQISGLGLIETFNFMCDRCTESYEQIWDFIIAEVEL